MLGGATRNSVLCSVLRYRTTQTSTANNIERTAQTPRGLVRGRARWINSFPKGEKRKTHRGHKQYHFLIRSTNQYIIDYSCASTLLCWSLYRASTCQPEIYRHYSDNRHYPPIIPVLLFCVWLFPSVPVHFTNIKRATGT